MPHAKELRALLNALRTEMQRRIEYDTALVRRIDAVLPDLAKAPRKAKEADRPDPEGDPPSGATRAS